MSISWDRDLKPVVLTAIGLNNGTVQSGRKTKFKLPTNQSYDIRYFESLKIYGFFVAIFQDLKYM